MNYAMLTFLDIVSHLAGHPHRDIVAASHPIYQPVVIKVVHWQGPIPGH